MNIERARQIVQSPQQILVTFEGDPVWIDELNESSQTATVHAEETGRVMQVQLDRLHEQ